jgi:conjugal transfer pilus assembly protein TraV
MREDKSTMKKIIFMFPVIILLSSCAEMNSQFDCPMKAGIRCESITSINKRVDRGELGVNDSNSIDNKNAPVMPAYTQSTFNAPRYRFKGEPLRYAETVQRIWIAPFEDKQGNYHQENDIYTVAKPGRWIGSTLKEIDLTGE